MVNKDKYEELLKRMKISIRIRNTITNLVRLLASNVKYKRKTVFSQICYSSLRGVPSASEKEFHQKNLLNYQLNYGLRNCLRRYTKSLKWKSAFFFKKWESLFKAEKNLVIFKQELENNIKSQFENKRANIEKKSITADKEVKENKKKLEKNIDSSNLLKKKIKSYEEKEKNLNLKLKNFEEAVVNKKKEIENLKSESNLNQNEKQNLSSRLKELENQLKSLNEMTKEKDHLLNLFIREQFDILEQKENQLSNFYLTKMRFY